MQQTGQHNNRRAKVLQKNNQKENPNYSKCSFLPKLNK